ncbi:SCO2522 family protein [Actinoplanes sp. HUAS TT8]|uniref:SCO2522 family protein n=1 Tax=Actinoplanes sp. HUAS TT8 TaxID=3447453 RepID=UPI003F51FA97
MKAQADFHESTADARNASIPLAHLSVELGHFYAPDLRQNEDFFIDHFRQIGIWYSAARTALETSGLKVTPRISTCVLIDDYFGKLDPPKALVDKLIDAARKADLEIDYLVRESGCAHTVPVDADQAETSESGPPGLSLAELVEARLVEDPPPETTGARPPVRQTGWLCNGQRSPATETHEAMKRPTQWRPPAENAAVNHSIFADIELWSDDPKKGRVWSCAMLAAVWQLLRLGVLRDNGRWVAKPQPPPAELPDSWRALPMVLQLNKRAAPFNAYRAMTICAPLFLPIEGAVRTILQQVAVDPAVLAEVDARADGERIKLPPEVVDRIQYLFVDTGPVRGAGPG